MRAMMQVGKTLGALLLLWLPICGCGEYYDDESALLYEYTAPPLGDDIFEGSFPEKSSLPPAKRSTQSASGWTGRRHAGRSAEIAAADENRVRPRAQEVVPHLYKSKGFPAPSTPSGWRETRRTVQKNQYGVFPHGITVCVGEDALFRAWGIIGELKNCTLRTANKELIQLYPEFLSANKTRIEYYDFGMEGERCGFRIRGVTLEDWGTYNLTVVTDKVTKSVDPGITVKDCAKSGTEDHYHHLPGELAGETCGPPSAITACYVEPPGGAGDAPGVIQLPLRDDIPCQTPELPFSNLVAGEWTCDWVPKGSMLQRTSKTDIEFAQLSSDIDVGFEWKNESSAGHVPSLDLRCNYRGESAIIQMCKFVQPSGRAFYPNEGLGAGRFSYLGRGYGNGDCGLSIEQPLKPEDIGVWRCEIYLQKGSWKMRGGYIEVGIANRTREEKMKTLRPWAPRGAGAKASTDVGRGAKAHARIEVLTGDPVVIGCSADAPLTLCLIRRPDGNATAPPRDDDKDPYYEVYGRGEVLGDCGLQVKAAISANHTGRWECIVSIEYGDAQVVPIDVVVHDEPLEVVIEGDGPYRGEATKFTCKSVKGVALEHCRFERPDRTIVSVMDSRHPAVHKASWAHGVRAVDDLSAGFCSVSIPALREEDLGEWTCVAKSQDTQLDYQRRFQVTAAGISAASVGVISAVVVLATGAGIVGGAVVYNRRRRQRLSAAGEASIEGHGPDDSVISFRRTDDDEESNQS